MVMLPDDAQRDRVTVAGRELVALFEKERATQIDRFIAAARGDLARGAWVKAEPTR